MFKENKEGKTHYYGDGCKEEHGNPVSKISQVRKEIEDKIETLKKKDKPQTHHGRCCTCRDCGHYYNDCTCDQIGILEEVLSALDKQLAAVREEVEKEIDSCKDDSFIPCERCVGLRFTLSLLEQDKK